MSSWDGICRVCASPSQYDIFSKIPTYLHESSNEFINWQKPINVLLEETTGLSISRDDGLPNYICALCISYLKHASTFRDQVIKNTLSLKIIKELRDEKTDKKNIKRRTVDKDSLLITEQQLNQSEQRKIDSNVLANTVQNGLHHKVSKELFQPCLTAPTQEYIVQQMRYLNLLFDKDVNTGLSELTRQGSNERENLAAGQQPYIDTEDYETETTSNDDNDNDEENFMASGRSKKHIFSYTEKNFEEDDIMNMEELRDAISVTIPETCKERKCRACLRRFMFEESYEEHMEKCFEFKFLTFIEEINVLLDIRRKKAVSPHEFIRRMIFSLRKICDFLKTRSEEIPMPGDISNSNNNAEDIAEQNEILNSQEPTKDTNDVVLLDSSITNSAAKDEDNAPLLNFIKSGSMNNDFVLMRGRDESKQQKFTDELFSIRPPSSRNTATPITIHNNILYEIERSESRCTNKVKTPNPTNMDDSTECVRLMRPIPILAASPRTPSPRVNKQPIQDNDDERVKFLQKLERAVSQTPQQTPSQTSAINTPSISVRKDLMPNKKGAIPASPSSFSARCNSCDVIFDALSAFEIHNAMYHNNNAGGQYNGGGSTANHHQVRRNSDEERERIIAMFENEDDI